MADTPTTAELIDGRFGLPPESVEMPTPGPLVARILAHRTHRRFRPEPVPDGVLEALLACAFSAPSKSDLQQASIVLVRDEDRREGIARLVPDMPWIASAPVFLVVCGDSRRIRRICEMRGTPFANDHLDALFNAVVDAALVMQNLVVAAESEGLGCCPISVIRNHARRVRDLLELPRHVVPVAGMCIGYPAAAGHVSMRLPPSVTVHVDRYDDDALVEEVSAYDRRRDSRFAIPREKWRRVDHFGEPSFYGWSEDKARQVSVPERDDFGAFVREQGFVLD
jgi:nitroreductase